MSMFTTLEFTIWFREYILKNYGIFINQSELDLLSSVYEMVYAIL